MQIECLITYTAADGKRFERGQLYQVDAEYGLWLMTAAELQFKVVDTPTGSVDDEPRDTNNDADAATSVGGLADVARAGERPPADRMVRGAPRMRTGRGVRNTSDTRQA